VIYSDSYGFRVDSDTAPVAAPVEFKGIYAHQESQRKESIQGKFLPGQQEAGFVRRSAEGPLGAQSGCRIVLAQAARRLANKIIYKWR
jgi:hypothetical protein